MDFYKTPRFNLVLKEEEKKAAKSHGRLTLDRELIEALLSVCEH